MRLLKFIIILLILISLVVGFTPLKYYYSYVSKQIRPIKLEQISGSAIKGSAQKATYYGLDLGQASWLIYPSSYNAVTLELNLQDTQYDVSARIIQELKEKKVRDIRGSIDWSMVDKFINFNHGKMSGYIKLDFPEIAFKDGVPERIIGRATTKELKLLKPIKKDLGEIEVVFTSDNPQIIVGQVNSRSNVINVSGSIYIHKNHRWEVKLTLLPLPGEYEVEYAIQNIGDRRRGGGRTLNMAGFY
jgi:hypothetical protein